MYGRKNNHKHDTSIRKESERASKQNLLLKDEDDRHTQTVADAHALDEDLITGLLRDMQSRRNLSCTSYRRQRT